MSSNDEKIVKYELRVEECRAKIKEIESGEGLYSDATNEQKRADIKSEKDAIRDCEAAIHDLRQQQQQSK